MVSLLLSLVIAALAAPGILLHYLSRLPDAPACPACRAVTCEAVSRVTPVLGDRLWAVLDATPPRNCTECGWRGRMRWRWAPERE